MSGEIMKTIEIEDDLYKYILNNIEAFGETPSQILRRLLVVAAQNNDQEVAQPVDSHVALNITKVALTATANTTATHTDANNTSTPTEPVPVSPRPKVETPAKPAVSTPQETSGHFCSGVAALFDDATFKSESVVTNKFMMMLTTMYLENTPEFVESADKIKGRTRAYLGTHLQELLNSDNQEELAQFKSSKPRSIPQTPFWVITNANTGRKRIILTQMMASMGYPHSLIERIKEEI